MYIELPIHVYSLHDNKKVTIFPLFYLLLFGHSHALQIATLMGLSWIFGFVAALIDTPILWWFFIVLSSTQGCFIFAFFALNRRVRRLWMIRYGREDKKMSQLELQQQKRKGSVKEEADDSINDDKNVQLGTIA